MKVFNTIFGFKWGFIEIERTVSNDGTNKKKRFNVLTIKHPKGHRIEIVATKEDIEIKTHKEVIK